MDEDIEAIAGDAEAVERHARANIETLRRDLEDSLRTELAHVGWQEKVLVEDDPDAADCEPDRRGFLISTSTEPPGRAYAWEEQHVEVPGVPLELVRAAEADTRWAPSHEGMSMSWGGLLIWLTDEAVQWEMYLVNILAFLDDVAARGGPRIDPADLSVDVDAAGEGAEPYWVPVGGDTFTVFMHGDVLGRDSGAPVRVRGRSLPWNEAVDAFVRAAAQRTD